jgi:hypothetical protein
LGYYPTVDNEPGKLYLFYIRRAYKARVNAKKYGVLGL